MKYILIIFACILVSCTETTKEGGNSEFNESDYEKVLLRHINAKMYLPNTYTEFTLNGYKEALLEVRKDSAMAAETVAGFEKIEDFSNSKLQVFADKEFINNSVWIQKGEYVELDAEVASTYYALLEEGIRETWDYEGLVNETVEKRFITTNRAKIIKIKLWHHNDERDAFQTQYLVSSKLRTFSIMVFNSVGEDFEDLVIGMYMM